MYVTVAVKMTEKYTIDQIPGVKDSLEQTTFDPVFHNLDASFRLTNFTQLKGWGCKIPQEVLMNLLQGIEDNSDKETKDETTEHSSKKIGRSKLKLF